ncbi:MAG: heme-binding domain-containing protein [Bacteroidetes bacterium]|nr:heme-binding domain-containing protein [Bacteroidota bacterium]
MVKKIFIALLVILIIMQFFHPKRNNMQGNQPDHISRLYPVSPAVKTILDKACNDCHSNYTAYPWYSNVQPIDWWMTDHIIEGKRELNFDEFSMYAPRRQYHKLEEIMKEVKEEEMPLNSYTWIHKNAKLSQAEKDTLINWAGGIREQMKSRYPADSLERPKK